MIGGTRKQVADQINRLGDKHQTLDRVIASLSAISFPELCTYRPLDPDESRRQY